MSVPVFCLTCRTPANSQYFCTVQSLTKEGSIVLPSMSNVIVPQISTDCGVTFVPFVFDSWLCLFHDLVELYLNLSSSQCMGSSLHRACVLPSLKCEVAHAIVLMSSPVCGSLVGTPSVILPICKILLSSFYVTLFL